VRIPVGRIAAAGAVAAFLSIFLLWPLAHVAVRAASDAHGPTLFYLKGVFANPVHLEAALNSFRIACWVTAMCALVSLPLAWLFASRSFAGKSLLAGLLLTPMILPPFVSAVGIKMVLAREGSLSILLMRLGLADAPVDWLGACPLLGIVALEVLHLFPIMYLNLAAALANIDPSLEEAAANLGAGPWSVFRRITLPLAGPGLFAGMALVFVWSFTELGTPLVFGVRRVLPVLIYDKVGEVGTNPAGYALVVFVLAISAGGFWTGKALTRRSREVATLGRMSVSRQEKRLSALGSIAAWLGVGLLLVLAIIPHFSVIGLAFNRKWFLSVLPHGPTLEFFGRAVDNPLTRSAMLNSLGLSLAATVLDMLVGFGIAWFCVRGRFRGADLLDALAMLPLAVPGLVIAFGYLGCFGGLFRETPFLSGILDPRRNPMFLLAVSYSIRRLPYMVRAAHAGLEQVSRTYEEAAANLGASPIRVIRRVTIPLLGANLVAGGILCFAFSMLEVSDSLILAQVEEHYPLTKAIYTLMESLENGTNVAAALGVWAMAFLGAALLWAAALMGRRMGQMFRA